MPAPACDCPAASTRNVGAPGASLSAAATSGSPAAARRSRSVAAGTAGAPPATVRRRPATGRGPSAPRAAAPAGSSTAATGTSTAATLTGICVSRAQRPRGYRTHQPQPYEELPAGAPRCRERPRSSLITPHVSPPPHAALRASAM